MAAYSDFVSGLLRQDDLLSKLTPTEPRDTAAVLRLREANEDALSGGGVIRDIGLLSLVRAALFYAIDALGESHRIVQQSDGDLAAYLHGMLHRREGDFDNARYWFRRAGELPFFASLHSATIPHSEEMAKQPGWDPYLFTGLCEQEKFGDDTQHRSLVALQRAEFEALFDYLWRQTVDRG